NVSKFTPDEIAMMKQDFESKMKLAQNAAEDGDIKNASTLVFMAGRAITGYSDKECKARTEAVAAIIKQAETRVKFTKTLQQVEDGIRSRELDAAGKALKAAQEMVGTDKKMSAQAIDKQKLFDLVQALDAKRKEYVTALKESGDLKDEQVDENA